tara:strand:+ start:2803 stop:3492 length:690 start_codon:yes stop_codon:yes gene_type:complete
MQAIGKMKKLHLTEPVKRIIFLFIVILCFVFLLAGAVNQGFTKFFLALPFAPVYAWAWYKLSKKWWVLPVVTTALGLVILGWNAPTNKIIYPTIGDTFQASCGWEIVEYEPGYTFSSHLSLEKIKSEPDEHGQRYVVSRQRIPCDDNQWQLVEVQISHHDLGTSFEPVFRVAQQLVRLNSYEFNEALKLGELTHPDITLPYQLQSNWTFNLSMLMMWPMTPVMLVTSLG